MNVIPYRMNCCVNFAAYTFIYKYGRGSNNTTWRAGGWRPIILAVIRLPYTHARTNHNSLFERAIAPPVGRRPVTVEARVRSQASACGIFVFEIVELGQGFLRDLRCPVPV